jgi:transposase InsO family protein
MDMSVHESGHQWPASTAGLTALKVSVLRKSASWCIRFDAAFWIAARLVARAGSGLTFEATVPNQRWVTHFTYVLATEGWLYVAVFLDLYSRMVVSWSTKHQMTAGLVTDALVVAIWRRGPREELMHRLY